MTIVGVDPGCSGALARVGRDGYLYPYVSDMPVLRVRRGKTDKAEVDGYAVAELLRSWDRAHKIETVVIERVGGVMGQAAGASFNFGRATGVVEGVAKALGFRVETVPPATWKKALGLRGGKDESRAAAIRRWPKFHDLFARKKDDGRAEAALIACWFALNNGTEMADVLS